MPAPKNQQKPNAAKRGRPAKSNTAASKVVTKRAVVKRAPVINVSTRESAAIRPDGVFPLDFDRLRCSLRAGNNVGQASVEASSNDTEHLLHVAVGGLPLDAGREFVRRLTKMLDDAEAEGLNVGI